MRAAVMMMMAGLYHHMGHITYLHDSFGGVTHSYSQCGNALNDKPDDFDHVSCAHEEMSPIASQDISAYAINGRFTLAALAEIS